MNCGDGLDDDELRALERMALADWSAAAQARVDAVTVVGRYAAVVLLVNGDYEYSVQFRRDARGRWQEAGSSSGRADTRVLEELDRLTGEGTAGVGE